MGVSGSKWCVYVGVDSWNGWCVGIHLRLTVVGDVRIYMYIGDELHAW